MTDPLQGMKTFLKKYANLIESRKQNDIDIAEEEFQRIKVQATDDKKNFKSIEGSKESNRKKNRYKDILPYDYTRVELPKDKFVDGSDYINANFIKDDSGEVCYIASQGPMPNTVNDFWKMIFHFKIRLIVMACKEVELGKARCQRYWPQSPDEPCQFNDITVTLVKQVKLKKNMKLRELKAITKSGKEFFVTQLHYMDWPDHGAPETSETIMHLIQIARDKQPTDNPPILIHCSAGCGRTGAIIALDYARKLILRKVPEINVLNIVSHLRKQRPAMVQSKEQYEFLYEVIREMVTEELSRYDDDCNATYVNIGYLPRESPAQSFVLQENVIQRSQSDSAFEQDTAPPSQSSRKIVLPTEHVLNIETFRRSRSLYGRNSPKQTKGPPVPRKVSEGGPLLRQLGDRTDKDKSKLAYPALPPNKPRSKQSDNYINLDAPSVISPGNKPNEEFFPPPKTGSYSQYPMKSVTSSLLPLPQKPTLQTHHQQQQQQIPTLQTHQQQQQQIQMQQQLQQQIRNKLFMPPNTLLSNAAFKLNTTEKPRLQLNSNDSINTNVDTSSSERLPFKNNPKGNNSAVKTTDIQRDIYVNLDKPQLPSDVIKTTNEASVLKGNATVATGSPPVIKPYFVTEIGIGRQEKPKEKSDRGKKKNDGWTFSLQTSNDEPPSLPERTPESFQVIRDDDLVTLDVSRHKRPPAAFNTNVTPRSPVQTNSSIYSTVDETMPTPFQNKPISPPLPPQQQPLSPKNPDQPSAFTSAKKNWKNAFKMNIGKKTKQVEESETVSSQDPSKIMFANTLYEFKSLSFPRRIDGKINGPTPPPLHWPKFPN